MSWCADTREQQDITPEYLVSFPTNKIKNMLWPPMKRKGKQFSHDNKLWKWNPTKRFVTAIDGGSNEMWEGQSVLKKTVNWSMSVDFDAINLYIEGYNDLSRW